MRTKDPKNAERKEELILSSARNCFISKGFHKTTMRDIAQEASISLGNIYQYFKGKNDIIIKFVELSEQETHEAVDYIRSARNFKRALKQIMYILLDDFVQKKELVIYLEIFSEALKNEHVKEIVQKENSEIQLAELFDKAEKEGKITLNLPSTSASLMILSAVETAAHKMMIHDKSYKKKHAKKYIEQVIDIAIA